jgi:hypothetical protein
MLIFDGPENAENSIFLDQKSEKKHTWQSDWDLSYVILQFSENQKIIFLSKKVTFRVAQANSENLENVKYRN